MATDEFDNDDELDVDELDVDELDVDELDVDDEDTETEEGEAVDDDDDEDDEADTPLEDVEEDELDDDELDEESEESLEVLLGTDVEDESEGEGRVRPSSKADTPIGEGEFTCRSCFLVKRRAQLADAKKQICLDCA